MWNKYFKCLLRDILIKYLVETAHILKKYFCIVTNTNNTSIQIYNMIT
jgi:hypothetical protein